MNDTLYPSKVTKTPDGAYRWSYDMPMFRPNYLMVVLAKVLGIISVAMYIFTLYLVAAGSRMTLRLALLTLLPFVGLFALAALIYSICGLVMGGTYHLRFEMNEEAIMLVRKASTNQLMESVSVIMVLTGAASGNVGQSLTGAGMAAGAGSGLTRFENISRIHPHPKYDEISLTSFDGFNQIWVGPESFEFVRDYLSEHLPKKKKK